LAPPVEESWLSSEKDLGLENFNSTFVGACSDKGPVRSANEDAYWVANEDSPHELGALYLVADGVGGQLHGAEAAGRAVEVISREFYESRRTGADISTALTDSINLANLAIVDQAQSLDGAKMGCTLVAAVQHEDKLHIAHVGDARAYLLMGNRLRRLTRDDTWVQKQVEAGIITTEQAEKHELRNVVTQVLGNKPQIDVHLSAPQELNEGDMFLLCSDGLHGVLSNEQLFLIMKNNHPQAAAEALVRAAIKADTSDNVTAVVVGGRLLADHKGLPPGTTGRRSRGLRLPLWAAVAVLLAIVVTVVLAMAIILNKGDVSVDLGGAAGDAIKIVPTDTAAAPTVAPSPTSQETVPAADSASTPQEPQPAATAPPSATLSSQDLATVAPPISPAATEEQALMGCVIGIGNLFVWSDEQVQTNTCDQFAQSALSPGEEVEILDPNGVSVAGPDKGCLIAEFIRVRSTTDPQIEGWVTGNRVLPLLVGTSCSPWQIKPTALPRGVGSDR